MSKIVGKSVFTVGLLSMLLAVPAFGASVNKSIKIDAGSESSGASSVNGSITVGEKAVVNGRVKTVNGSIRVDDGASIRNATTVNGGVNVANNVRTGDLKTVNGKIRVGDAVTVDGNVEAVNGKINVGTGSSVSNGIANVNGIIELTGADVGGDVSTVSGDVYLSDRSIVRGNLIVEKPGNWSWNKSKKRKPRIVIGPRSVLEGSIKLEREVELFVSESAKIGGVEGEMSIDDAIRFSGERP